MAEKPPDRRAVDLPDAAAIAAAHAIYTPFMLGFYDRIVHGLSNRLAWGCPTGGLLDLYRQNLTRHHLEAGVGTGFFIHRANPTAFDRLVLLDINRHCLAPVSYTHLTLPTTPYV